MERLKANKTSLWTLARDYTEGMPHAVGKRESCRFWKGNRQPSYYLEWTTEEGCCKASLMAVLGDAFLSVDVGRKQVLLKKLSCADLRRRGMTEIVETAAERKRSRMRPIEPKG